MNWKNLLLIALFALVATPLAAAALPDLAQCGRVCTIRNNEAYLARSGVTYTFDTLTLEPHSMIKTSTEQAPLDVANGGTLNINAKNLFVSGTIAAVSNFRFSPYNGGNAGTINLEVRDRLEVSPLGVITAIGAPSLYPNNACPVAGNGGNGGNINIKTTPNAIVNIEGQLNVTAGIGATPNENCPDVTAGQVGIDGTVTFNQNLELDQGNMVIKYEYPQGNIPLGFPNQAKSGQEIDVTTTAFDQFGGKFNPDVTWTTSNEQVVSVDQLNSTYAHLTAMRSGTATITATSTNGNWRATSRITVLAGNVATISPEVDSTTILTNRMLSIQLNAEDANGNEIASPLQDATFRDRLTYKIERESTATGRLTLSQDGKSLILTAGNTVGTLLVTIGFDNSQATVQFNVQTASTTDLTLEINPDDETIQIGDQIQFTLNATDAQNRQVNLSQDSQVDVIYSVSNNQIAEINQNGLLTAKKLGTLTVTARVISISNARQVEVARTTAQVKIETGSASQIEIRGPLVLTAGQTVQYKAKVKDDADTQLARDYDNDAAFEYIWIADKGTIYANGTYTAKQAGDVTITVALANDRSVIGSKTIAVYPKEKPVDVKVTTTKATAGQSTKLTAVAVDEFGNELDEITATWTLNEITGTAALSGNTLTGQKEGEVEVTAHATVNGAEVTQTQTIEIEHGIAKSIKISPDSKHLRLGDSYQLEVSATDKYGNEFTPEVTWTSTDSDIVDVDHDGEIEADNYGTSTIKARLNQDDDVTDTILVTVDDTQTGVFQVRTVSGQVQTSAPVETKFTKVKITPDSTDANTNNSTGLFTANDSSLSIVAIGLVILLVIAGLYYMTSKPTNI